MIELGLVPKDRVFSEIEIDNTFDMLKKWNTSYA